MNDINEKLEQLITISKKKGESISSIRITEIEIFFNVTNTNKNKRLRQ